MDGSIYDERNGFWYELQELPEEAEVQIGVEGQRRRRYLKSRRKASYTSLLTSGKLNRFLADIDRQAEKMFLRPAKEPAKKEGITEKLKAAGPMMRGGKINNIRNRATEL